METYSRQRKKRGFYAAHPKLHSWRVGGASKRCLYGLAPESDARDMAQALASSQEAWGTWRHTSIETRAQLLLRVGDILTRRQEEFALAESRDQGKTLTFARTVDIPRAIRNFTFFATAIQHHQGTSSLEQGVLNYAYHVPIGVCGLISP